MTTLLCALSQLAFAQVSSDALLPPTNLQQQAAALPMDAARRNELTNALSARDYKSAEKILVGEIDRSPKSPQAHPFLLLAAGVFFLDGEYLNAAIAFKKAEAIGPLDERSRFTLAMAYVRMDRRDWAQTELERLAAEHTRNTLYLYWLARLDYDASRYVDAAGKLERVIKLDPAFVRAHDNLGLCYESQGRFEDAVQSYREAIRLNRLKPPHSPWPNLNLAIHLIKSGSLDEAESLLREALGYDPKFAQARYQLGVVLERRWKTDEAIKELNEAIALNQEYAEPYYSLGRIYQRRGEREKARQALEKFQELKKRQRGTP